MEKKPTPKTGMIKLIDTRTGHKTYSPIMTASEVATDYAFFSECKTSTGLYKYKTERIYF